MYGGTLPPITFAGPAGLAPGVESLPDIELELIFVDKGTNAAPDGSRQEPFHTVAAGLAAAAAVAAAGNPAVCLVYPGEYNEDNLVMGQDYVSLVGVGGRDAVRIEGAAATVLTVTAELTSIWGITFAQTLVATDIAVINTGTTTRTEFHECTFETAVGGSQPVRVTNGGALFKDCRFYHGALSGVVHRTIFETGASANNDVVVDGCHITGCMTLDESIIRIEHCKIFTRSPTAGIVLTTGGEFHFRHNHFYEYQTDGLEFQAQPNVAVIHDNWIQAATGLDITATLAVTGFDIAGNLMYRGMHGNISHIDPIKYVAVPGNYKLDYYASLQHALDSCTFDDCVVKLLDDLTLTAALVWNKLLRATIDGNGFHQVSRVGGTIIGFGGGGYANRHLALKDLRIRGIVGAACTDGFTQSIRLERCYVEGYLYGGVGSQFTLEVVRTTVLCTAIYLQACEVRGGSGITLIKRSYLKGYNFPAIYYTNGNNDNLKIEHSTIWHGSGAANLPIGRDAAQTPDYCSHHDAYNTDPLAGGWLTNLIAPAQRYNSYDVQTDY